MFFLANKATNECNTSILCDFDWKTHFCYYFNNSRSSSRSKGQFQGQIVENVIFNKHEQNVIALLGVILSTESIYDIIMVIQGHLQGQ